MKIFKPHILKHDRNVEKKSQSTDTRKYIPEKYQDFAQKMEQQFAEYMVKQMTNGLNKEAKKDPAGNYYHDLMTKEYSKTLTNHNNGLGIQELILDDVYPKKFRNPAAYQAYLNEQNKYSPRRQQVELGPQKPTSEFENIKQVSKPEHIMKHGNEVTYE